MWDTVVAGAGPAGAAASLVLARAGKKVLLADPLDDAGHKVGEALPAAGARLLRALDLPGPDAMGGHCRIGGNLSCWGSDDLSPRDFFREPEGPGWRLERRRFEGAVRDGAIDAGACLKQSRIVRADRTGSHWTVAFADGTEAVTRWIVDAGGRKTTLARQLGAVRQTDAPLVAFYALGSDERNTAMNRTVVEAVREGWWYAARLPSGKLIAGIHVRPAIAREMSRNPGLWHTLWARTTHLARLFPDASFHEHLSPLDAGGARLDRFHGDGWIACGDAALSFDPLSSQGLLTSLYTGMRAGQTILDTHDLADAAGPCEAYRSRLESIRSAYCIGARQAYREEQRWSEDDFWH